MKHKHEYNMGSNGFVLIELIIATLIAAMISGVLLTALYQSSRIQIAVDDAIDMSERIAIIANQLEKDVAGAFVPEQAEKKDETADTAQAKPSDKKDEAEQKPAQVTEQPSQKKEQKPIEKIFYSTNKDGMLDTLSFVTNNPLVVFVGKDVGVVKPKVVRVQYTLKPEAGRKGSYALFRQESNELDVANYKNVRPYEVISGVKKCTVNFTARIEKKQEEKAGQAAQEKQKISYEYKTMPEWTSEQKKDTSKEAEKKAEFPRIPYAVEFKITLWDKQDKRDKEFTVVCEIPVDSIQAKKQEQEKQPEPPQQETQKPTVPGDISKQPGQQQQELVQIQQVQSKKVVYNGVETLSNALGNLKKLFGQL